MALPTLDAYAFPVTIPSTGKPLNLRPFLVREEKLLLMAQESEDYQQQAEAVAQVIRNCTNNQLDPIETPYFDLEYLLLQLRSRSVSEIASPIYTCHYKADADAPECGHQTKVDIDLSKVEVDMTARKEKPTAHLVDVSSRYVLCLRDPNIFVVNELLHLMQQTANTPTTKMMDVVVNLFHTLKDADTGTIYDFKEYTLEEKIEFMDNLTPAAYAKILEFMDTIPTLTHNVSFTCQKCDTVHSFTLSGLSDFLV